MKSFAALALALLMCSQADAALQRCVGAGGRTYWSDRGCPSPGTGIKLGAIGAPADRYRAPPYAARLPSAAPQAEGHLKYLDPHCASIYEAIRTGPARGVDSTVVSGLRREYQQKCELVDRDARDAASREAQSARQADIDRRDAQLAARAERQDQAQQCSAMRDSIGLRRKRERDGALNDKEIAALRSFEASFNARCLAV